MTPLDLALVLVVLMMGALLVVVLDWALRLQRDMLDRFMARSLSEYVASTPPRVREKSGVVEAAPAPPVSSAYLDEQRARLFDLQELAARGRTEFLDGTGAEE